MLNTILDKLPPGPTMFFGAIYVVMPILPEPHLVQKAVMLSQGLTLAPIDWLDIVMHSSGGLLALAVYRRSRQRAAEAASASSNPMPSDDEQA
ncbi:hypothetical protein [Magnetovibrio sp.]|uniref:hypothetical protein n=1 Tax=Magnetovibrio sp. TaxID=2024836 RepID=UPI002F93C663